MRRKEQRDRILNCYLCYNNTAILKLVCQWEFTSNQSFKNFILRVYIKNIDISHLSLNTFKSCFNFRFSLSMELHGKNLHTNLLTNILDFINLMPTCFFFVCYINNFFAVLESFCIHC